MKTACDVAVAPAARNEDLTSSSETKTTTLGMVVDRSYHRGQQGGHARLESCSTASTTVSPVKPRPGRAGAKAPVQKSENARAKAAAAVASRTTTAKANGKKKKQPATETAAQESRKAGTAKSQEQQGVTVHQRLLPLVRKLSSPNFGLACEPPCPPSLACSPSGNHYIVTPGRHRIDLTDMLARHDRNVVNGLEAEFCPYLRANAHYSEDIYQQWKRQEEQLVPDVFMLTFREGLPIEDARRVAVQVVLEFGLDRDLCVTTIHTAILNLFRLVYSLSVQSPPQMITYAVFIAILVTSIRHAVKMEERWELLHHFRGSPDIIWEHLERKLGMMTEDQRINYAKIDKSHTRVNQVEAQCLAILEYPQTPPVAPDFLARYVVVGGWREYGEDYRDLANYLLGVSLFAHGDGCALRGIKGSRLAAAALALAVKIINTDGGKTQYEFWPRKMEVYSGYDLADLKPAVHGLSHLLRHKPQHASVLELMYPKWGTVDWK